MRRTTTSIRLHLRKPHPIDQPRETIAGMQIAMPQRFGLASGGCRSEGRNDQVNRLFDDKTIITLAHDPDHRFRS